MRIRFTAFALAALMSIAPAAAQLTLQINNHTCGLLDVLLADAPGCAPHVPGCLVQARNGFSTKFVVRHPYRPGYFRLAMQGQCTGGHAAIVTGWCDLKIKTVWPPLPGDPYDARERSQTQSLGPPYTEAYPGDIYLSLPGPATLMTIHIYQGICDEVAGDKRCEVFCRVEQQQ